MPTSSTRSTCTATPSTPSCLLLYDSLTEQEPLNDGSSSPFSRSYPHFAPLPFALCLFHHHRHFRFQPECMVQAGGSNSPYRARRVPYLRSYFSLSPSFLLPLTSSSSLHPMNTHPQCRPRFSPQASTSRILTRTALGTRTTRRSLRVGRARCSPFR